MNLCGSPLDYLTVFLAGVALSFTPCIYPLIPVSIGVIGSSAGGSKLKAFILSLFYVSAIALTYSIMGVFASLTGQMFGRISSSPVSYFILGGAVIIFGISMLGIFNIPALMFSILPGKKKNGALAVFCLGLSSGLIASPCVTPALGVILTYISLKKNILYGATLLFTFAYGMGLILILAGAFSSILASLPKSGKWMLYIKRIYAFILIGAGLCFIYYGIRRL